MPVMTPVAEPAVAMMGLLLLQVPPLVISVSVMDDPIHNVDEPVMAEGGVFTVTVVLAKQPAVLVNVMTDVPAVPPVTIPVEVPIAAIAGLLLVHVPLVPVVNAPVEPEQITTEPEIVGGRLFTVISLVVIQPEPTE
jgi:hypothetical protein